MNDLSTASLFATLFILIILSGFFSGSETALMTLNRYRLKSLADKNHKGAKLAARLLQRPDRLLGLILLGNNIVNIFAATITTVIALRLYGEVGIAIAPIALAFIILVFAEVTPKTLAALKPEKLAFPSAYVYTIIALPLYPFVWLVNIFSNALLRLIGIHPDKEIRHELSADELRAVVIESEHFMPQAHSDMLLGILDLERVSVEDIMIPRNEILASTSTMNGTISNTRSHIANEPVYRFFTTALITRSASCTYVKYLTFFHVMNSIWRP